MRASCRGVKRVVVDDHRVHAARFPLANAAAVLPLFAASIAVYMGPIGRVRCIHGTNVQVAIEDGECVSRICLAAGTSAIGPRTLRAVIQAKNSWRSSL